MPLAFLVSILGLVLSIISLLYPREAFPLVLPLIGNVHPYFWMTFLLIGVVFTFIGADYRWMKTAYRPRIEFMLFFFPLFIFVWAKMPLSLDRWDFSDFVVCGFILAVFLKCLYHDRNNLSLWGINKVHFIPALRLLWVPTVLFVSVPIVWRLMMDNPVSYAKMLFDVVSYPFYAFAQLLVFLAFPVACFKKTNQPPVQIVLAVAGLFALAHWPNGIVMLVCLLAMIIWSWAYLRQPNLFAVAISMGIAAAVFGQALPYEVHHKVRVGPDYVYQQLMKLPPENIFHDRIQKVRELKASGDDNPSVNHLATILNCRELSDFSRSLWVGFEEKWGMETMIKGFLRGAEVRENWHNLLSWPTRINKSQIRRDTFYGHLDICEVRSGDLFLSGWMADVKTGFEAKRFHIFINGAPVYAAPPNVRREDVSRIFDIPSDTNYGFRFKLPGRGSADIKDLRIFGFAGDGIFREILYPSGYQYLNLYAGS
jgi:CAAX prenyl protease-like protein